MSVASSGQQSSCKGILGFFSKLSFYLGWIRIGKMGEGGAAVLALCRPWLSRGIWAFSAWKAAGFGEPGRAHRPPALGSPGPRGLRRSPAASVPAQLFSPSPQRAALKPEREGAEREAAGAAGPRRHWRRTG